MSTRAKADNSKNGQGCSTASRLLQDVLFSQDRDFGDECDTLLDAIEVPHPRTVVFEGMPARAPATDRHRSAGFLQDRDSGDETRHGMN
jgi:hypothetical protein